MCMGVTSIKRLRPAECVCCCVLCCTFSISSNDNLFQLQAIHQWLAKDNPAITLVQLNIKARPKLLNNHLLC